MNTFSTNPYFIYRVKCYTTLIVKELLFANDIQLWYDIVPAYQCFKICSDCTKFHEELNFFKRAFLKNGCPLSFYDKCFKMVINKLVIKCSQVTAVEKKTLILTL